MRRSQPAPPHAEAVARRLATLSAELAAVRGEAAEPTRVRDLDTARQGVSVGDVQAPRGLGSGAAQRPPEVPVPGRHASRRRPGSAARVPGAGRLGERVGLARLGLDRLGPWHVTVVLTLITVAVGVAAWVAVRSQAEPMPVGTPASGAEPLTPQSAATPPGGVSAPASSAPDATRELTVDVAGKVRSPGIAVLPPGSRVVDALEAAGGARRGVDLTSLNLARPLVDGEQILVGVPVPPGPVGQVGTPGTAPPAGTLVNINTADQTVLETLPGVGPVTAQSIIDWRTTNGGFSAVDELIEVDGIGEATLGKLAPLVTI